MLWVCSGECAVTGRSPPRISGSSVQDVTRTMWSACTVAEVLDIIRSKRSELECGPSTACSESHVPPC